MFTLIAPVALAAAFAASATASASSCRCRPTVTCSAPVAGPRVAVRVMTIPPAISDPAPVSTGVQPPAAGAPGRTILYSSHEPAPTPPSEWPPGR